MVAIILISKHLWQELFILDQGNRYIIKRGITSI